MCCCICVGGPRLELRVQSKGCRFESSCCCVDTSITHCPGSRSCTDEYLSIDNRG